MEYSLGKSSWSSNNIFTW